MAINTDNFPVNQANFIIENSDHIPKIGFLGGEQGKEINDSIKRDYKKFPVMQIGTYSNKTIKGSNPFYVVGVQSKLKEGFRVATPSDLESAIRLNVLNLLGTHEDSGLVLRTGKNPNTYLTNDLIKQISKRTNKKAKMPIMIPLCYLELKEDSDSPYGLSFKLKEDADIFYAPILGEPNGSKFYSEDVDLKTGLPTKVGKGNRSLWTREGGLSRLCLSENLDIGSRGGSLDYSDKRGRVVLISDGKRSLRDDFIIEITNYPREEEIYSHELPHAIIFFGDQLSHVNIHPKPSLLDNEVSYVHVPSKPSK